MKPKIVLAVMVGLGLLGSAPLLRSADSPPKDKLHLKFHGKVALEPTNSAPAGAEGSADFNGDVKNDHAKSKIKIHTKGLVAGDYLVSAIKRSDGSVVPLGQIIVKDNGKTEGKEADVDLPAGLDVRDIALLVVADTGGNAVLVGDLTAPGTKLRIDWKEMVDIEPGSAAPDASGKASIRTVMNHGNLTERFALMARHVPPNTTFDILADGTNVGQVTSTGHGTVAVRGLSGVSLVTVHSVQLTDAGGNVALSASF
jgi:hypothetical protein